MSKNKTTNETPICTHIDTKVNKFALSPVGLSKTLAVCSICGICVDLKDVLNTFESTQNLIIKKGE